MLLLARSAAYAALTARIQAGQLQFQKVAIIGQRADTVRFLDERQPVDASATG